MEKWIQLAMRYEKPCVTRVDYLMSYSKLVDQTAAVVAALTELGVRPEDRVLITLPDGPGFAEAFAGTIAQGAVPLPVNHCYQRTALWQSPMRQVPSWCWPRRIRFLS
jgi:acyl-CoA synthetase (AMP-forming)/AMP-acid ligase II